jgi:diguanylate cyclase (GGDEF)-like protein/PAS domain S-box-containing protein
MLAYEPGVPVGYDLVLTTLSLLAAMAATTVGLAVAVCTQRSWSAAAGGAIVGAGVAIMHFTGMMALELPGRIAGSPGLMLAAIVLGVALATSALGVAARGDSTRATLGAASLLALSIVALHFTAMGAVLILPDPARVFEPFALSETMLAMTVAAVTCAVLCVGMIGAAMDRRLARQSVLLDSALNNMSQGLMMFDAQSRLILCNQRYLDLYRLPKGSVRPGMTLREIIQLRVDAGTFPGDADRYCAEALDTVARGVNWKKTIATPDGRTIALVNEMLPDGGWIATHLDITEEQEREASFRLLFESNPVAMWVWDHETLRFLAVNDAAVSQYGYDRDVFLTKRLTDIRRTDEEFSVDNAIANYAKRAIEGRTSRHVRADGSVVDVAVYGRIMTYEGRAASLVALVDVTERKKAADELRRTQMLLDAVFENMPAILAVKDVERRYVLVNKAAEQCFGVTREEILGKRADEIFPHDAAQYTISLDDKVMQSGDLVEAGAHAVEMPHHGRRVLTTKKLLLRGDDGAPQYLLSLSEDVTDRARAEQQVAHMARHDTLTDLPNRAAFNEHLVGALKQASTAGGAFAILFIDLDRFKEVNDIFGHSAGDALLCEVGQRMRDVADGAFVARLGGDEFTLIVTEGAQPATAEAIAERLLAVVASEIEIGAHHMRIGMSIGVAVYPADGEDAATLLSNADAALYRAKAEGRGSIRFFAADMDKRLRERRALQHELRSAIERGEVTLHYQPQAVIGGDVIGFEALGRWHHPTRGMIPPSTFIPLAEESGLIVELGEWILREACREAASWDRPLQIAVNLSPIQFRHGDLPALVHSVLLQTGLAPHRLELEITEGVLIGDFSRAQSILRRLKSLGVHIAMDDFGTGYSSLSYLQAFPFDKIKIDGTFIANLTSNEHSAAIVRAVIGLGRGLHLPVIAEGVETSEQLAFLTRESCNEVQGYLIGRPASIESYAEIVGRAPAPKLKVAAG